jgi:hypothetical protein
MKNVVLKKFVVNTNAGLNAEIKISSGKQDKKVGFFLENS